MSFRGRQRANRAFTRLSTTAFGLLPCPLRLRIAFSTASCSLTTCESRGDGKSTPRRIWQCQERGTTATERELPGTSRYARRCGTGKALPRVEHEPDAAAAPILTLKRR